MNYVVIAGHLGADPEERTTPSGQKLIVLVIAAKARRSGNNDETIWWRATVWGNNFERMMPHFKKGSPIIVMGEMNKPRKYLDRNGETQVSMEMTVSDIKFSPFGRPQQTTEAQASGKQDSFGGIASGAMPKQEERSYESVIQDDEIPF